MEAGDYGSIGPGMGPGVQWGWQGGGSLGHVSQDEGLHGLQNQLLQLIQHRMQRNMHRGPGMEYMQQQHMGASVSTLAMAKALGQGPHGQRLQAPIGHVSQALVANVPHGTGAMVHAKNKFPFTASNAKRVLRNGGDDVMETMGWSGLGPQVTILEQMQMMRQNQKQTSPSHQHIQQQVAL